MRVVGTAGHVDHGKSTLIAALTGTHPDRLKEEQAREMTIDLGFAWLTLPTGEPVGIVDVPGHRDFIENMLAGVGGIDAALFVVAADEGVMPQTREHLAILDLLQIPGGVIVLTKIDLVDDPEWLDLVEADVRQAVAGTVLAEAPIVRVSARTRAGLEQVIQALAERFTGQPARPDFGRPRLWVDRAFSMPGFGTVVTGTLLDGQFKVGSEVEVLPSGLRSRVRGLQSHRQKVELAVPGSRTAINLAGVDVDQVPRGTLIALPDKYRPTRRLDVFFRALPDVSAPLRHNTEVKFFLGTRVELARVRLLGCEELAPGAEGWLQVELQEPVVAVRGDRFILRRPSPGELLGGGEVVDPHPTRRHRRFAAEVIEQLAAYRQGSPAEVFFQASLALGPALVREVTARARQDAETASQAVAELVEQGLLVSLEPGPTAMTPDSLVLARPAWQALHDQAVELVTSYHRAHPLRRGIPREELKSRLKVSAKVFAGLLARSEEAGELVEAGTVVQHGSFTIRLSADQEGQRRRVLARFAAEPFTPPGWKEVQTGLGEDLAAALIELGDLVQIAPDVAFRKGDYQQMRTWVESFLREQGSLTVIQFRDHFQTSRKFALAVLEHLDGIGVTVRAGDYRQLKSRS